MSDKFDFIIVGSGPGGSVLANRLSENSNFSICVLEAGGMEIPEASVNPHRWNELLLTELDWAYMSEPQPAMNNRQVYSAAGRVAGGTSVLYHMIHTRGRKEDYDNWSYNGCSGWSYNEVLPYLKKLENQQDDTNPDGGKGGAISVINAKDMGNPVSQSFINACGEMGFPIVDDFNASNFGAGWHHVDIKDGQRNGVYSAYLEPTLERPNVTFLSRAFVNKLIIEDNVCVGVEFTKDNQTHTFYANKEVLLCAGAIQSPKILMLSGIGDEQELNKFDIPVKNNLPGVGKNFHDHPLLIGPIILMDKDGPDPKGNMTEAALFWGSEENMPVPDMEICLVHRAPFGENFFANVIKRVQTGEPIKPVAELVNPKVILTLPGLVKPLSRGYVKLASANPTDYPVISCNYGDEPTDIDRMVKMVKISREIYKTKAMAEWGAYEISPGAECVTDEQIRDWVINNVGSYYHFVGSCKMGVDKMAVVDNQLKVYGVDKLRVVDASVMPTITSSNTHTTVVMIGEKAADLIKNEYMNNN
jgi:choline dehydrogenase